MSTLRSLLLVARHAFAQSFRGGRLLVLLFFVALPVLVAALVAGHSDRVDQDAYPGILLFFVFQVVVPLVALMLGVGALGDEIEGRTITYLFTRPVPRPVFFVGRAIGFAAGFAILLGLSVAVVQRIFAASIEGLATGGFAIPLAAVGGFFAYLCFFAALRTLFRRALYVGAFLAFVFEGLVSKLPGARVARLSLWHHLVVIFERKAGSHRMIEEMNGIVDAAETASGSATVLVATAVASLALGAWIVHRNEVQVPAAAA